MEASALSSWQVPGRIACCSRRSFPAPGRGGGPGPAGATRGGGSPPGPTAFIPAPLPDGCEKGGEGSPGGHD